MSSPSRRFRPVVLLAMVALLFSAFAAPVGAAPQSPSPVGIANRTVLFASDGMRPDLMEKYAAAGYMPTYKELMKHGVTGDNGMIQAFPPNTGVGWYTMATGTYPGEHGSTNNTFFRGGDTFSNRTSFSGAGVLQADTIANAAERAGKKVAQIDWVGGAAAEHQRPDRRLHELLLEPRRARRRGRPGRAGGLGRSSASPTRSASVAPRSRLDRRPDRRSGGAAEGDDLDDQLDDVRRARTRTAPTTSTSTTASPAAA